MDDEDAVRSVYCDDLELSPPLVAPNPGQQLRSGFLVLAHHRLDSRNHMTGTRPSDPVPAAPPREPNRLHTDIVSRHNDLRKTQIGGTGPSAVARTVDRSLDAS